MNKFAANYQDIVRNGAILCATFLICFINTLYATDGLFFVALVETKGLSRQEAVWPFNMWGVVNIFGAPLVSYMGSRWSIRLICCIGILMVAVSRIACFFSTNLYFMIAFYGIVKCSGAIITVNMLPAIIINSFNKNGGFAMAVYATATPLGYFIWIPVTKFLLDHYGLNGALLILGALSLNGLLGAIVLGRYSDVLKTYMVPANEARSASSDKSVSADDAERVSEINSLDESAPSTKRHEQISHTSSYQPNTDEPIKKCIDISNQNGTNTASLKAFAFDRTVLKKVLTSRIFLLASFTRILCGYIDIIFKFFIVDYMKDKGIEVGEGIYMMTAFSGGQFAGRLVLGWLSDRQFISRQLFVALIMLGTSITYLALTFTNSFGLLLFLSVLSGFGIGSMAPSILVLFSEYLKKDEIHLGYSFSRSIAGIFIFSRSPMLGAFRDLQGSYDNIVYIMSGLSLLTFVVWLAEALYHKKTQPVSMLTISKAITS